MTEMEDPENEYRIFVMQPNRRCGVCAFKGEKSGGSNVRCVLFDQKTNIFAGCNKFRPEYPETKEVNDGNL